MSSWQNPASVVLALDLGTCSHCLACLSCPALTLPPWQLFTEASVTCGSTIILVSCLQLPLSPPQHLIPCYPVSGGQTQEGQELSSLNRNAKTCDQVRECLGCQWTQRNEQNPGAVTAVTADSPCFLRGLSFRAGLTAEMARSYPDMVSWVCKSNCANRAGHALGDRAVLKEMHKGINWVYRGAIMGWIWVSKSQRDKRQNIMPHPPRGSRRI